MSSVPVAFAHPDTEHAHIFTDSQEIKAKFIGINGNVDDESAEFLSYEWVWENFILLLIGSIVGIMAIFISINYRKDFVPLLRGFSHILIGFSSLFLLKNRQSKEKYRKSKNAFQEIFGLD